MDADLADLYGVPTGVLIVTSSFSMRTWGGRRTKPYAFTEQGVAMLSSVLRSTRAVAVNAKKLDELERRVSGHDEAITDIVRAIRELAAPPEPRPRRRIGFVTAD